MSHLPQSRVRIALNVSLMNDLERLSLVAGIQKVAAQSPLMQVPAIAASYAALVKKGAAFKANNDLVAADEKQLKLDVAARDLSRADAETELVTLKTLVAANAKTAADVAGMGFAELLPAAKATQAKPDVPGPLVVKTGKVQGRSRVVIAQPGKLQGTFVAEASTDPIGPSTWFLLPGSGKQRKLSGYASGTKLWVRFAAVRHGQQSDWCTPVLVTIP
jgi:hypothetical protein